ncbi:hypothetical protein LCGC14_2395360 [marine sediment metagenome]|uniref:Uncharacterized protein n=1 Tax=marine sediment metagenome TaxID=412755 RepID=A0A0F9CJ08_9ZZZZ
MIIKEPRIYTLIEWIDSKGITDEWEFLERLKPITCCICRSIGFIVEETDDYVTIAQSLTLTEIPENSQVLGRMSIPKVAIRTRKDFP